MSLLRRRMTLSSIQPVVLPGLMIREETSYRGGTFAVESGNVVVLQPTIERWGAAYLELTTGIDIRTGDTVVARYVSGTGSFSQWNPFRLYSADRSTYLQLSTALNGIGTSVSGKATKDFTAEKVILALNANQTTSVRAKISLEINGKTIF